MTGRLNAVTEWAATVQVHCSTCREASLHCPVCGGWMWLQLPKHLGLDRPWMRELSACPHCGSVGAITIDGIDPKTALERTVAGQPAVRAEPKGQPPRKSVRHWLRDDYAIEDFARRQLGGNPSGFQASIAAAARRMELSEPFRFNPRQYTADELRRCIAEAGLRRREELQTLQQRLDPEFRQQHRQRQRQQHGGQQ